MRFIKENFWWFVLVIVAISTVPVLIFLPSEHWIRRLILAPFGVLGAYTIFLGAIKMAEQFEEKIKEQWKLTLIFAVSMFGVVILFIQFL